MKIIIMNRDVSGTGGLEVFCCGLIGYLYEQGHEVHVVVSQPVDCVGHVHVLASGGQGKLATFCFMLKAIWLCWKLRPDVTNIHSFDSYCAAALFVPGRVLISMHGFFHLGLVKCLQRLRPSIRIIANSAASVALLKELAGLECAGYVYPLVHVDPPLDKALARCELGLPEKAIMVLHIGRLVAFKSQETLVQAFAAMEPRDADSECVQGVIVGEGPLAAHLEALIQSAGISDRVQMAGGVPHNRVVTWLSAADLYVQSSTLDRSLHCITESFGISIVEAMAHGLPLVLSDIPVFRELVGESDCAVFFPAGDATGLAACIKDLVADSDRRADMGLQSRRQWQKGFTPQESFSAYLDYCR